MDCGRVDNKLLYFSELGYEDDVEKVLKGPYLWCQEARRQGFPLFMDSGGKTCARGFDPDIGFGDGNGAGITSYIQNRMGSGTSC